MSEQNIPRFFLELKKKQPALLGAVEDLGRATREAGPLDDKAAQLIQLAAATAIRSEGGVHSHARRALGAGAAADEVRHAIMLLTSTVGFPTVVAALSWAEDILARQQEDN